MLYQHLHRMSGKQTPIPLIGKALWSKLSTDGRRLLRLIYPSRCFLQAFPSSQSLFSEGLKSLPGEDDCKAAIKHTAGKTNRLVSPSYGGKLGFVSQWCLFPTTAPSGGGRNFLKWPLGWWSDVTSGLYLEVISVFSRNDWKDYGFTGSDIMPSLTATPSCPYLHFLEYEAPHMACSKLKLFYTCWIVYALLKPHILIRAQRWPFQIL